MRSKFKVEIVLFVLGIFIFIYPIVSHYYNSFHQSQVITSYQKNSVELDTTYYQEYLNQAKHYNNELYQKGYTHDLRLQYSDILNINQGMIGAIEINKINVYIPIFHGTSDEVLNNAIGHIETSSFPIGGNNTHSILSGHTGLPNNKLFTDLDQLKIGDLFDIHVLNETYTYQINDIYIVNPSDLSYFNIIEGKDYCTLVTCTPYGINSHRLLIRGERVSKHNIEIEDDLIELDDLLVIIILSLSILFIIFIYMMRS